MLPGKNVFSVVLRGAACPKMSHISRKFQQLTHRDRTPLLSQVVENRVNSDQLQIA